MIKLDVEPYCHTCPAFEPVTYNATISYDKNEETFCYVRCEDRKRCRAIERYIRKELESAGDPKGQQTASE